MEQAFSICRPTDLISVMLPSKFTKNVIAKITNNRKFANKIAEGKFVAAYKLKRLFVPHSSVHT